MIDSINFSFDGPFVDKVHEDIKMNVDSVSNTRTFFKINWIVHCCLMNALVPLSDAMYADIEFTPLTTNDG